MKHKYFTFLITLMSLTAFSQAYEFSLQYTGTAGTGNFQFALVATPDFDTTSSLTSDMGVTIYIPTGYGLGNFAAGNSNLQFFEWQVNGDVTIGSEDLVSLVRSEIVQNSFTHTTDDAIELVLFEIISDGGDGNNPASGSITLADNLDSNVTSNFFESFLNINLGSGTQDYFSQHDPSANSISFETLSTAENTLNSTDLKLYPNPTSDYFKIESDFNSFLVSISSIDGRIQKELSFQNHYEEIDITQLPNGLYFIKIYNLNNDDFCVQQIMKI